MKQLHLPLLIVATYAFVLMGCGQKGPLYLPEKQTTPVIITEPAQSNETSSQAIRKTETIEEKQVSPKNIDEAAQ